MYDVDTIIKLNQEQAEKELRQEREYELRAAFGDEPEDDIVNILTGEVVLRGKKQR